MNFAQAKRAVAEAFGGLAIVEHAKREVKAKQYRVFLVKKGEVETTYHPIGVGSNYKAAVEMALKAEVKPTPNAEDIAEVVIPPPGHTVVVAGTSADEERVAAQLGTYMQSKEPALVDPVTEAAAGYKPGQAPQGDDPMVGGRTKMGNMLVVARIVDPANGHRIDRLSCGHLVDKTEKRLHDKNERWCNVCYPRKPRSKKA